MGRHFVAVTPQLFGDRAADLAGWAFGIDGRGLLCGRSHPSCGSCCEQEEFLSSREGSRPLPCRSRKLAQLEAVKGWFTEDWRRIEPKLRTSIVEGISVFLSLFDDSPKVKRVFAQERSATIPKRMRKTNTESHCLRFPG